MKRFLVVCFLICISVSFSVVTDIIHNTKENKNQTQLNNASKDEIRIQTDKLLKARNELAIEVNNYIKSVAPQSQIDPFLMVDLCWKYNVDLAFVMAQGQLESHYATAGTAKKTNSIFNVGAYDGHSASRQQRNGFGFDDPNDSIEPFLILLTTDYLVNGKTTNDLMKRYTNYLGMRYASNTKYEVALSSVYRKITTKPEFSIAYTNYKTIQSEIYG